MKSTPPVQRLTLRHLTQAAERLRILAHPQQLDLTQRLLKGRYVVGELAEACHLAPAMTSGHLRLMQRCGLLAQQRDNRCVYYPSAEPCLRELKSCLQHRFQNT